MTKEANFFISKELLRPREELDNKSLADFGWRKGDCFNSEDNTIIALSNSRKKTLTFSNYWFKNPSRSFIKEIVLHEIAHAIVDTSYKGKKLKDCPPHNNIWRYTAKKLGCKYGAKIPVKKTIFGKSILKNA